MRSRALPPRNSYTGTPKALPLMSHRAISMPETMVPLIGPPRKKDLYISCHRRSISNGSRPSRYSPISLAPATTVSVLVPEIISPQPSMPSSVVILTKIQRGLTSYTVIPEIFIGKPPNIQCKGAAADVSRPTKLPFALSWNSLAELLSGTDLQQRSAGRRAGGYRHPQWRRERHRPGHSRQPQPVRCGQEPERWR